MSNADKIKELEAQISKLRTQDERMAAMTDEQQLAIQLHGMLCHWNHTDGCSWGYEIDRDGAHDWTTQTHGRYLDKAVLLCSACKKNNISVANAVALFKMVQDY